MRIAKAPLRVSLFGGGTDLPEYCIEHGSTIISFAIDKYVFLCWNQRPTGGCRLTYGRVEEVSSLTTVKHTLVQAAAERYGIPEPCTLSIVSDVPKGTGLGSSSVLAVLLTYMFSGSGTHSAHLAQEAYHLERSVSPVGVQDHLPAVYGYGNVYNIFGTMATRKPVPRGLVRLIEQNGLLLYTNRSRKAEKILRSWAEQVDTLKEIQALAQYIAGKLDGITLLELSQYLEQTWELKSRVPGVVDDELFLQYQRACDAGALGGKLLGAGDGGCWFFLVTARNRQSVIDTLSLPEIPFRVVQSGVREVKV